MSSFMQFYRCYPMSFSGQHHLENGNKIILPISALDLLSSMTIEYPMLFQIVNPSARKISHCGVMEFSAEEGEVFLPSWLMKNMDLEEADMVTVKNVCLKKATFVKFRPHEQALMEVSNPKAVLEKSLRGFSCLTAGDTIVIDYNGKKCCIDVLETKPDKKAVSIIETDCEVDFAPALDYKEPEKPVVAMPATKKTKEEGREEEKEVKFRAFTGVGRRLDGGKSSGSRKAGKLVSGSSEAVENLEESERVKKKENGFQPFCGKSYKLSG
ncbi:Ubiquitin fusion degradation protein 1-like protein [Morus notabilis]|uniref:Ubiquitin fusion degradation protein 1-like protein n=1 Tax=Morus notabilis TaxID=981085 RepID=W9QHH4_9ROSA|nr:ubiquitin fusion degradation protein 1 homolog [Morus notabilis]EXB37440.1 Ubiquitin fusion degradation protein 1-like protein [Morus notabilis]